MSTQFITLPDPAKGVFTAVDQDDIPPGFATDLENFYLDRPGKLRKRDGVLAYGSNLPSSDDYFLRTLFRFVNNNISGGAAWIALFKHTDLTGRLFVSNEAGSTWTQFENIGAIPSASLRDEMRSLVIGTVLRLAFSRSISPVWYGYIKRKFCVSHERLLPAPLGYPIKKIEQK